MREALLRLHSLEELISVVLHSLRVFCVVPAHTVALSPPAFDAADACLSLDQFLCLFFHRALSLSSLFLSFSSLSLPHFAQESSFFTCLFDSFCPSLTFHVSGHWKEAGLNHWPSLHI